MQRQLLIFAILLLLAEVVLVASGRIETGFVSWLLLFSGVLTILIVIANHFGSDR